MADVKSNVLIPIFRPSLPIYAQLIPYLKRIDDNGWYSNYGPLSSELEGRIAEYCGLESWQVVTVANATLALEGALSTHINEGEWDCPSWTFAATPSALARSNKRFRFVDIDSDWRVSPQLSSSKNKMIVDVLPFGASIDVSRLGNEVETVLIDAAASFDSLKSIELSAEKQIGMVLSFHATKSLPGGEGAVFISNDKDWVSRVRQWGNFGFSDDRRSEFVGTNSKMNEYSAAVILTSLDNWDEDREKWIEMGNWAKRTSDSNGLRVQPSLNEGFASPYWIIEGEEWKIKSVEKKMQSLDIQTRRWWGYGCHNMTAFEQVPTTPLEKTDLISRTTLGLPFYKNMPVEFKERIESALDSL
jgi:dTDP-4-amino-4,6-dideoxygalactose transaminase